MLLISLLVMGFEISKGVSLGVTGGAQLSDERYSDAATARAELYYTSSDRSDAFLSPVIRAEWQRSDKKNRTVVDGGLMAVEVYHPAAFRVVAGGGAEKSNRGFSPLGFYEFNLGWYLHSRWSLWAGFTQRFIFRDELSMPLSPSLGIHFTF